MTKHAVHCFSLLGYWLSLGLFNGLLFMGAFGLYLQWGLRFAQQHVSVCRCGPYASFFMLNEWFPADMPLTYLINWLIVFIAGVVIEFLILFSFHPKTKRALMLPPLAFAHNLPGLLLILTLMSQADYFALYLTVLIFSLPLLGIYSPLLHFHPTDPHGALTTENKLLDLLSYFGLAYDLWMIILSGQFLLLPIFFLLEPLFLLTPFYFFIVLFWLRQRAKSKLIEQKKMT